MNIEHILLSLGYIGFFGIIFAESGLFFGFFLPGDTLLFIAGLLAFKGQGGFNILVLILLAALGAILGDNVGYYFGRKVGKRLFSREDSVFFHKRNLEKAEQFYEKHGKLTIILARFVAVVRTFAPIVAGIGKMNYRVFVTYNIIGGLLWTTSLLLLGYFLGAVVPDIDKYILPIVAVVFVVSIVPSVLHLWKESKQHN